MALPCTAATPRRRSNCWATWPWAISRRSHLGHLLREGRPIDRLDLSRSGGLFGGPYLWFNYITRLLVQETALLILDYNRHAVPLDRLACSPDRGAPRSFSTWLADRLKIDPDEVWLPEPIDCRGRDPDTRRPRLRDSHGHRRVTAPGRCGKSPPP